MKDTKGKKTKGKEWETHGKQMGKAIHERKGTEGKPQGKVIEEQKRNKR